MPFPRPCADRDGLSSTFLSLSAATILTVLLSLSLSTPASALQTVPDSPCAEICTRGDVNLANGTVCLDDAFKTGAGHQFRECTTCLLNSTAVDTPSNISDVYWGLFNLRYTLSECMFAYPAEIVSISSPCQVTCAPLMNATTFGIGPDVRTATDETVPNLEFCNQGFGGDHRINNCSFCYSYIPQQLFIGNFMQALHIACRQPPAIGQTFFPDGRAIFNESAIPGPAPASSHTAHRSGITGWKLGLVVAFPIVGGVILFGLTCFCCFKFTKKRRQKMAANGRMSTYHDRHPGGEPGSSYISPINTRTPPSQYHWQMPDEAGQEMERISYLHTPKSGNKSSPGISQGRWSHATRDDEEEDVPLSAVPRDDVGPGAGQAKDPYLHDQYFGVASSGVPGEVIPGSSHFIHPDQRGSWVR
ncbi:hypothetical protein LTR05_001530 [Lithohypha guttulata]|uniref:Uncharacterized protein n=1 Tax=Lithohypha guttulata TaxID=1690604 RepID=A0AAN7YAE6_9EURO|nr:hypothetical protein LTR05_001530 [Lithohypha guttulata]